MGSNRTTNSVVNFQRKYQEPDAAVGEAPHNLAAEQSVLGGLFISTEKFNEVQAIIQESDFYRRDHRIIYRAIQRIFGEGDPVDVITVEDFLKKNNFLDAVGGIAYLGQIAKNTPSAANIITYAEIVRGESKARAMLKAGVELSQAVLERDGIPLDHKLANHISAVEAINAESAKTETGTEVMARVIDEIDARFSGDKKPFISTGFNEIDRVLGGGLQNHLIVIGGNPSHGKTTLATNIIENVLLSGVACAIYSYEMTTDRIAEKMLSSVSRVEFVSLRSGNIDDAGFARLSAGISRFNSSLRNLLLDNSSGKTIAQIAAQIRADYSKGTRVFMLDHAQMIPPVDSRMDDNSNTKNILNTLMSLKNKLKGSCIILISPCRKIDSRQDKRPLMDDLFGSRAVSGDADVVLMIYRDEVYDPDSEQRGTAEVIVRKNRDGAVGGTIRLQSNLSFCRFEDPHEAGI